MKKIRRFPLIRQASSTDCGVACLVMLFNHFGLKSDTNSVRSRYSISMQGMTLHDLQKIASDFKFTSKGFHAESASAVGQVAPCIAHFDDSHFVILYAAAGGAYYVADPAKGRLKLTEGEFQSRFSGRLLMVRPGKEFMPGDIRTKLKLSRLIPFDHFKRAGVRLVLLSLLIEIFVNLLPIFMQKLVDSVIPEKRYDFLSVLVLGFILVAMAQCLFVSLRSVLSTVVSVEAGRLMKSKVLEHLLRLPLGFFEQRTLGDIQSKFSSINRINQVLTGNLLEVLIDVIMGVIVVVILLNYSVLLACISFAAIALYCVIRFVRYRFQMRDMDEVIMNQAELDVHFVESVRGVSAIKTFGKEKERSFAWNDLLQSMATLQKTNAKRDAVLVGVSNAVTQGEKGLILWFGGRLVMGDAFSLGALIAYISFKDQLFWRFISLADRLSSIALIKINYGRVKDIIAEVPEPEAFFNHQPSDMIRPLSVLVHNLSYRYSDFEDYIFEGLFLSVNAGEHLVVTGRSGAGKSTFAKLLCGLLQPSSGAISVGDRPLVEMRSRISIVQQRDSLFIGSVADNISMFDVDPARDAIVAAAKIAAIHEDILELKMGYETHVGDMGSALSGGQIQRVLLARALYRRPAVLILDEATSHLDEKMERVVTSNISKLKVTCISFAHRKSTIECADRVVTLGRDNSL